MTKYICIKEYADDSRFILNDIYYVEIFADGHPGNGTYVEIYGLDMQYIGAWLINFNMCFMPLSEYREKQINEILNED